MSNYKGIENKSINGFQYSAYKISIGLGKKVRTIVYQDRVAHNYTAGIWVLIISFLCLVGCRDDELKPTLADLDPDIAAIVQDGFTELQYAQRCRGINVDGSVIDGQSLTELPVGGGYSVECETNKLNAQATFEALSSKNEPWCFMGKLSSSTGKGATGATVTITSSNEGEVWTLLATRDGGQITIKKVTAFGALIWPLWAERYMGITDFKPNPDSRLYVQLFGM